MNTEAIMRAVIFLIITFFGTFAAANDDSECDCGEPPFVEYELGDEVELDENSWRVGSTISTIDMTKVDEPTICKVQLTLFENDDPVLYVNIQTVPDGDFEVYYLGRWMLASKFEQLMQAAACMSGGEKG
jgi:hypothetical protein